ncbi:ureidoglycolate hydrolase [Nadsonia fulvescens var. elongata DSM 6958]|uniref:Ureidoglycolate hydrolase n=1 Tax=Nadsonia fulvescens var. elongata DSM 6958 TaxID=857566 RepID=A0A1E3PT31_9ASCO|nr:ureidoglycolate hydrolase [Nadsonia fulvescens var. elongata DSM 6958]
MKITASELRPEAFSPFGTILSSAHQLQSSPESESPVVSANYGTATKIVGLSKAVNDFDHAPSGQRATVNWHIFRCKKAIGNIKDAQTSSVYNLKVLEKHPYSTQTFMPMGRLPSEVCFLVIVALGGDEGPDPSTLAAFTCTGAQAVTYGVGVWHAPMVVIDGVIDFGVLVAENGVPAEECVEVDFLAEIEYAI